MLPHLHRDLSLDGVQTISMACVNIRRMLLSFIFFNLSNKQFHLDNIKNNNNNIWKTNKIRAIKSVCMCSKTFSGSAFGPSASVQRNNNRL